MKQNKLKLFVVSLTCVTGAAWLASFLVFSWLEPEKNVNLELLLRLRKAAGTGHIENVRQTCADIQLMTMDEDIRKAAGITRRTMKFYQDSGITELENMNNATGFMQAFFTGLTQPDKSVGTFVDGVSLMIESGFGDHEALFQKIDTKYAAIMKEHEEQMALAILFKRVSFWAVLVGGFYLFAIPVLGGNKPDTVDR